VSARTALPVSTIATGVAARPASVPPAARADTRPPLASTTARNAAGVNAPSTPRALVRPVRPARPVPWAVSAVAVAGSVPKTSATVALVASTNPPHRRPDAPSALAESSPAPRVPPPVPCALLDSTVQGMVAATASPATPAGTGRAQGRPNAPCAREARSPLLGGSRPVPPALLATFPAEVIGVALASGVAPPLIRAVPGGAVDAQVAASRVEASAPAASALPVSTLGGGAAAKPARTEGGRTPIPGGATTAPRARSRTAPRAVARAVPLARARIADRTAATAANAACTLSPVGTGAVGALTVASRTEVAVSTAPLVSPSPGTTGAGTPA